MFIDPEPLSRPGYHAVQVPETMLRLPRERRAAWDMRVVIRDGTAHHYSNEPCRCSVKVRGLPRKCNPSPGSKCSLPRLAKKQGFGVLFSPGFVCATLGLSRIGLDDHDIHYRIIPRTRTGVRNKNRHAMHDRVRSLGKVSDEESSCAALAAPGACDARSTNVWERPALEELALGAPLICSNLGALPDVAGEAAIIIGPDDAEQIADAVALLQDDGGLRSRLQLGGLERGAVFLGA